jgi:ABC-type amino acid transport substrate-binding protein
VLETADRHSTVASLLRVMPPHATRRAALAAAGGMLTFSTGCLARATDPLVVAVDPGSRPFAARSRCCTWETTELQGLDVDVATAIADRLDETVDIVAVDPAELRAPPAQWSFDVAMGGQIVPDDPAPSRRYVGPYVRGYHCILAAPSATVESLRGAAVGAASDRAVRAADLLREALGGDLRVERLPDEEALYGAFGDDERVAGVVNDQVTNALAAARDDAAALLAGDTLGDAPSVETPYLSLGVDDYGLVVAADDPLGDRLADALDALRTAGRLSALRERYFTPAGLPRQKE